MDISTDTAASSFAITANGTYMGDYPGATEAEALDAYARDAGHASFADLTEQHPDGRDDSGTTATRVTTRDDFTSRFASMSDAIEFENAVLSIGDEFLPECAMDIINEDPAPDYGAYYAFLISQIEG